MAYDAEVIVTLAEALKTLPLPEFVIRVSNRKLLSGVIRELNLEQVAGEVFDIIDHAEKVSEQKTQERFEALGIGTENVVKITTFMQIRGKSVEVLEKLRGMGFQNEMFQEGVRELGEMLEMVEMMMPTLEVMADMLIVRGLDYYTGTVFETIVPEYREIGSICSGGRYENLAENYTDQALPGVGGSIGLTRLFYILQEFQFVKASEVRAIDICVVPISKGELEVAGKLAKQLRKDGKAVDLVLTERKLGDKMKYAAKVADFAVVVGEEEARTGAFQMKNLETGETTEVKLVG